jgi:hypothetical protein
MLVRLYAGEDGQSHFEDLDLHGWPEQWVIALGSRRDSLSTPPTWAE